MNATPRRIRRRPPLRHLLLAPIALGAALLAAIVVGLASAAVADASSVVYVGSDGNVRLVSPDGRSHLQLTANATADNRYRSPSQADSGRVVALRKASSTSGLAVFLDRQGNQVDAWNLPASGTGVPFAPYNGGQISPEGNGGMLVYDYWHADGPLSEPKYYTDVRVGFASAGGMTNPCLINCHGGYLRPRWLPGTPFAGFVSKNFARIDIQRGGSAAPTSWIQVGNPNSHDIESFDVARSGGRVVVETSLDGGNSSSFEFFSFQGAPGSQISFVCVAQNAAPATAYPRYSPDGSMVSWTGPDGVYVSPAPTVGNNGLCNLQPQLVAPGGSQADWGKADVPAPPPEDVDVPKPPKAPEALKEGVEVTIECPEACSATVTGSVSKATAKRFRLGRKAAVVATGKGATNGPGATSFMLEFKPKARKKLAKAKSFKLALVAKVKLASGGTETLKDSVVLRK